MLRAEEASSTAVLIERGGKFFAYDPDLGIVVSGDSVESAHQRFVGVRSDFLADAERAGLTMEGPVAVSERLPAVAGRSAVGELGMFLAKICILLAVVGVIVAATALITGRSAKPLTMADVADKAGEIARDISSMPPEKKELLRQSVGVISRELAPVGDAWRNPAPPK